MAASVVNSKQTGNAATTSLAITSATAGNLLVAFASQTVSLSSITGSDNISGSTGWVTNSTSATGMSSSNTGSIFAMYKTAVGGETTITPTFPGTGQGLCCFEISGLDNTPTIDVIVATNGTGTAISTRTSNAVTTTNTGSIILGSVGHNLNPSTITSPWGTTALVQINTVGSRCMGASLVPGTTLSSAQPVATWTNVSQPAMLILALKPTAVTTISVNVSDSSTTSENIGTLGISYGVDVEPNPAYNNLVGVQIV